MCFQSRCEYQFPEVYSSCITEQLLRTFPLSFPTCTGWLGISSWSFQFSEVNFLPTPIIIVVSHVLRFPEDLGRMVDMLGVTWVQLTQYAYFFPLHIANPSSCADLRYSNRVSLWSMQRISFHPPFFPPVLSLHMIVPSFSQCVVCRHRMFNLPFIH
jgi:hypothetical protein